MSDNAAFVIGNEAYLSADYARAEADKLWAKVWQVACREEEIEAVGDYVTYDIGEESIIVVRVADDRIAAYFNVCQHRGRRLTERLRQGQRLCLPASTLELGAGWPVQGDNARRCLGRCADHR